jgi:quercetin dioxygenase-like cupin family protein
MADFTIVNLKSDVKDSAPAFGLSPALEARFAKGSLQAEHLGVSYQRIAAGEAPPFAHRHPEQPEELYVVVDGTGTITLDGAKKDVAAWDVIRVAGPVVRSFEAGPDGLELLAFGEIHPEDSEIVQTG